MLELVFNSNSIKELEKDNLVAIQNISGVTNSKIGITGCLFYYKNEFVGILEGKVENVEQLFVKIESDNRHRDISILAKGPIGERQFEDWGMISVTDPVGSVIKTDHDLLVENILALARLAAKGTYGSKVFWHTVEKILRED
tara:strand:+ start:699 stop:1124 length:426 start_codon:yes stop_codon:yes gene_type:complete